MSRRLSISLAIGVSLLAGREAQATTIEDVTCARQSNKMRYDCTVDLSESDTVRIGHRPAAGGSWNWSDWAQGDPVDFVLYNFKPEVSYEVKAQVAGGPTSDPETFSDLGTSDPELPSALSGLSLGLTVSGSQKTNYVMFETPGTGSSRRYIAIVNVSGGFICWYQDVQDAVSSSRITGWSYTDDNTVLAVLNQGYLYEWDLDGSVLHSENLSADCQGGTGDEGPCPHHDAYRNPDNGRTYLTMGSIYDVVTPPVANPTYTGETGLDSFVEDGYRGFSSDWSSHSDYGTIADMSQDPNTYGGPRPECLTTYWTGTLDASYSPCDWTHANGISAMQVGSTVRVYLSLRNWDRIVAWDPVSETVKWELSGYDNSNVGDLALSLDSGVTGDANFYGQHHVTYHNGDLLRA
jgi:hypothetical protein